MRLIILPMMCSLLKGQTSLPVADEAGSRTGPFRFTITTEKSTYKAREIITVVSHLRNETESELTYRTPYHNAHLRDANGNLRPGAPTSRHLSGTAVDLKNVTRTFDEWRIEACLASAAKAVEADEGSHSALCDDVQLSGQGARADWVEPYTGPCGQGCVHADWRDTDNYIYNWSWQ